jgi:CheY-like chemotaxis protein
MQIMTDVADTNAMLRLFGQAITTDWFSWRGWYVVTLSAKPPLRDMMMGRIATTARALLGERDGVVAWPQHGPCFAIFAESNGFDIAAFQRDLSHALVIPSERLGAEIFSVERQSGEILTVLSHYLTRPAVAISPAQLPDFSESIQKLADYEKVWNKIGDARARRTEPHVMVVDDDALTRCIVSQKMKQDYSMLTAVNVTEAVRKHLLFAPNIVFLDIDLPDHNGLVMLQYIRSRDPDCRVVMFSGNTYFENRLKAFACGADGFLAKPFRRQDFIHYINRWQLPVQGALGAGKM